MAQFRGRHADMAQMVGPRGPRASVARLTLPRRSKRSAKSTRTCLTSPRSPPARTRRGLAASARLGGTGPDRFGSPSFASRRARAQVDGDDESAVPLDMVAGSALAAEASAANYGGDSMADAANEAARDIALAIFQIGLRQLSPKVIKSPRGAARLARARARSFARSLFR